MSSRIIRNVGPIRFIAVIILLSLGGCFSSLFTLGPPDAGTTSRIYVGDWNFPGEKGFKMAIRNFDDKSYVVQMISKDANGKSDVEWYRAFTVDVKENTFAHLKKLNDDGTLDNPWLIYRVAVTDGGQLVLRGLNDDFFKGRSVTSNDSLRKLVEANVDNDAMYETNSVTGTRDAR